MLVYENCPNSKEKYCYNGGECFYIPQDPTIYICSCFMPYYGPRCEHDASKTLIQSVSHSEEQISAKRATDRGLIVAALVFVVITFVVLTALLTYWTIRKRGRVPCCKKSARTFVKVKGVGDRKSECGVQVSMGDSPTLPPSTNQSLQDVRLEGGLTCAKTDYVVSKEKSSLDVKKGLEKIKKSGDATVNAEFPMCQLDVGHAKHPRLETKEELPSNLLEIVEAEPSKSLRNPSERLSTLPGTNDVESTEGVPDSKHWSPTSANQTHSSQRFETRRKNSVDRSEHLRAKPFVPETDDGDYVIRPAARSTAARSRSRKRARTSMSTHRRSSSSVRRQRSNLNMNNTSDDQDAGISSNMFPTHLCLPQKNEENHGIYRTMDSSFSFTIRPDNLYPRTAINSSSLGTRSTYTFQVASEHDALMSELFYRGQTDQY